MTEETLKQFEWVEYVFVKGKGWTHESELKPGDQYRLKDGSWETVEPERNIETTHEHPFYVKNKGWTPAAQLNPGDLLRTDNGWVPVKSVSDTGRVETVYNLRVSEHHTYFVGNREWGYGVWAHNALCAQIVEDAINRIAQGAAAGRDLQPIVNALNAGRRAEAETLLRAIVGDRAPAVASSLSETSLTNAWGQIAARANAINNAAERAIEGSHVASRIRLERGVAAGSYNYVVDMQGNIWLAPTSVHHSALVAAGAEVRSAGQMVVRADGQVFANAVSGHYMRGAQLTRAEIAPWEAAMRESISHVEMTATQLFADNTSLARFGFRAQ